MYFYFKSSTDFPHLAIPNDITFRRVSPSLSLRNIIWFILVKLFNGSGGGDFFDYQIVKNGVVVSRAQVVSWMPIFPFMPHNGVQIGPCSTIPSERGKGYYPLLLQHIMDTNPNKTFYMIINTNHKSSIRGVEKVGFQKFANGIKKNHRYVKISI